MSNLKVGDRVEIYRAYRKDPAWVAGMDQAVGRVAKIRCVSNDRYFLLETLDGHITHGFVYYYPRKCLRPLGRQLTFDWKD